jgi:hypothetical protein
MRKEIQSDDKAAIDNIAYHIYYNIESIHFTRFTIPDNKLPLLCELSKQTLKHPVIN